MLGCVLVRPAMLLRRQSLPGEIRQHLPSRALLASRPLLHCEQDIVIQAQRRAHARDANASLRVRTYPAAAIGAGTSHKSFAGLLVVFRGTG